MIDNTRIWRLPLPSDLEPEGFWCVSFVIPEGDDYAEALRAALGLLTIAKTFERDETHVGAATVAKTWERALYLNPMSVDEDCEPIVAPPIPDDAAADDAAAALFTQFFAPIITQLNECAPTEGDCFGCVNDIWSQLVPYGATEAVRGSLSRLCDDLNQLSPEDRAVAATECFNVTQYNNLKNKLRNNPYDWLNQLAGWMFDWLNATGDEIVRDLNTVGGLLGGAGVFGYIRDHGGIPAGGGATFGDDCDWIIVFNFFESQSGWHADHNGQVYAEYDGAWRGVDYLPGTCAPGLTAWIDEISISFDPADITSVRLIASASEVAGGGARLIRIDGTSYGTVPTVAGDINYKWEGSVAGATHIAINVDVNCIDIDFGSSIFQIEVGGTGPIPPQFVV